MLNRTVSANHGVPLGVFVLKIRTLEIHQEEPTTSENIPDNFSEIDKEVKEPQLTPSQIELVERPGERAFLHYVLKNHQVGLKGRKGKRKIVIQYENSENPSRCFVRLFKLYLSKCPQNRPSNAFYLKPLKTAGFPQFLLGIPHWLVQLLGYANVPIFLGIKTTFLTSYCCN